MQSFNSDSGGNYPSVPSRPSYGGGSFIPTAPAAPSYQPQQTAGPMPGTVMTIIAQGPVAAGPRMDPIMKTGTVSPEVQSFRGATSLSAFVNYAGRYAGAGFNRTPRSPSANRQNILNRYDERLRRKKR